MILTELNINIELMSTVALLKLQLFGHVVMDCVSALLVCYIVFDRNNH